MVEIDPVVHQYAIEYFDLPINHTAAIEDALTFVERTKATEPETTRYNYIIHDVFTGGAEPVDLFTFEFLEDLDQLLKPDGVIAIVSANSTVQCKATRLTIASELRGRS